MNETQIMISGNLVDTPELRYTQAGQAVASFRIASTPRYRDNATGQWKDGDTLFLTCKAWRQLAENAAECLTKGSRAIVTGRLGQRTYETPEGARRTVYEVTADDIAPSLRTATAQITKTTRGNGSGQDSTTTAAAEDPWSSDHAGDEPPF
jgi:single-strand DNA-binding protein